MTSKIEGKDAFFDSPFYQTFNQQGFTWGHPSDECTTEIDECDILEGKNWYMVVIWDVRFRNYLRMAIMRPYINTISPTRAKELDTEPGEYYAWVDAGGNVVSHYINPVHPHDDEFVMMCKKI